MIEFHQNTRVRIKDSPDYSYDDRFESLAPNSEGRVQGNWSRLTYNRQEIHTLVKFPCGNTYPFYQEELEKI